MEKSFRWKFALFLSVYFGIVLLLFWVVKEDWERTAVSTETVNPDAVTQEIDDRISVKQAFIPQMDQLNAVAIHANKLPNADGSKKIQISVTDTAGKDIYASERDVSSINQDGLIVLDLSGVSEITKNNQYFLTFTGNGGISLWYGSTRSAGKINVNVETGGLEINGKPVNGELVMQEFGINRMYYMRYFWPVAIIIGAAASAVIIWTHQMRKKGIKTVTTYAVDVVKQYSYLLKTLVIRDFEVKYQASVLGVLWSFLNPLLMTFVYMIVFSTIFRSSIENFVIYLMSGIVLFNYVSEATNLGMQSIVGNAGLITKVYIPKYVFPISKALSSGINLAISLIPLMLMMAITGVEFRKSLFLLPFVLSLVIVFCIGLSLVLASAMVFFRDTQFLWGITLTIWNFLSPIFYPESIIPARLIGIYHMNPLYQYLFFLRTIILGGISPTPITYFYCILASSISLLIGILVFKKTQDRFVLHL